MTTELSTLKSQVAALRGACEGLLALAEVSGHMDQDRWQSNGQVLIHRGQMLDCGQAVLNARAALAAVPEPAGDTGQVETWIDASSQQPPDQKPVLVILPEHLSDKYNEWGGHIGKARWLEDHWQVMGHGGEWRVSHWMPLPKIPAAILATAKETKENAK